MDCLVLAETPTAPCCPPNNSVGDVHKAVALFNRMKNKKGREEEKAAAAEPIPEGHPVCFSVLVEAKKTLDSDDGEQQGGPSDTADECTITQDSGIISEDSTICSLAGNGLFGDNKNSDKEEYHPDPIIHGGGGSNDRDNTKDSSEQSPTKTRDGSQQSPKGLSVSERSHRHRRLLASKKDYMSKNSCGRSELQQQEEKVGQAQREKGLSVSERTHSKRRLLSSKADFMPRGSSRQTNVDRAQSRKGLSVSERSQSQRRQLPGKADYMSKSSAHSCGRSSERQQKNAERAQSHKGLSVSGRPQSPRRQLLGKADFSKSSAHSYGGSGERQQSKLGRVQSQKVLSVSENPPSPRRKSSSAHSDGRSKERQQMNVKRAQSHKALTDSNPSPIQPQLFVGKKTVSPSKSPSRKIPVRIKTSPVLHECGFDDASCLTRNGDHGSAKRGQKVIISLEQNSVWGESIFPSPETLKPPSRTQEEPRCSERVIVVGPDEAVSGDCVCPPESLTRTQSTDATDPRMSHHTQSSKSEEACPLPSLKKSCSTGCFIPPIAQEPKRSQRVIIVASDEVVSDDCLCPQKYLTRTHPANHSPKSPFRRNQEDSNKGPARCGVNRESTTCDRKRIVHRRPTQRSENIINLATAGPEDSVRTTHSNPQEDKTIDSTNRAPPGAEADAGCSSTQSPVELPSAVRHVGITAEMLEELRAAGFEITNTKQQ